MAYRLEVAESVPDGFERCWRERLDRAVAALAGERAADPAGAVHEARKALKMERSLLRLGRAGLPAAARRRHDAALRDCARRLAPSRDGDALVQTLDGLAGPCAGRVPQVTIAAIRERLIAARDRRLGQLYRDGALAAVARELGELHDRGASELRLRRGGFAALSEGLRDGYRRGRRAMARATRHLSPEHLHDWRKRVKDLTYHLRLLEPAAPDSLAGVVAEARRLAALLGEAHDLAILAEAVRGMDGGLALDTAPLLAVIERRRAAVQSRARLVGGRLYAEPPRAFTRRLGRYWRLGRAEQRAAESVTPGDPAAARRS